MKVKKDRTGIEPGHAVQLGNRIREIRESFRMIQKDFAEGLRMSESHYNQFEKGKAAPGYDFFYRLMKKYRVSLDYLFYGIGDKFLKSREVLPGDDLEEIESTADLVWYLEHSPIFRQSIKGYANRFLYKNENIIKRNIERNLKKKEEEV